MSHSTEGWHGTTILTVRKGNRVVVVGDGQVSVGHTIMKSNARKVRPLSGGAVLAGFAGAPADAMTLFERLEGKLEQYPGQLMRACVELAKDWRMDRYLRRLEAAAAGQFVERHAGLDLGAGVGGFGLVFELDLLHVALFSDHIGGLLRVIGLL